MGDLRYLGGEWRTRPDGLRYIDETTWDLNPATFPTERVPSAAGIAAYQLAKALGVEEVARLAWHPRYIQSARIRPAGPREWGLLERAMDSADPNLTALAELTAAFLQPD
jgi:hypothetical protein